MIALRTTPTESGAALDGEVHAPWTDGDRVHPPGQPGALRLVTVTEDEVTGARDPAVEGRWAGQEGRTKQGPGPAPGMAGMLRARS